ncbi:MAG: hypothetical protein ACOCM4_08795 [Acetivibrio ethanolgignens]
MKQKYFKKILAILLILSICLVPQKKPATNHSGYLIQFCDIQGDYSKE